MVYSKLYRSGLNRFGPADSGFCVRQVCNHGLANYDESSQKKQDWVIPCVTFITYES